MDRIAARGDGSRVKLPVGRVSDGTPDFSFSGLKTAMLREFARRGVTGETLDPDTLPQDLVDLFASFQRAIVSALVERVAEVHAGEGVRRLALSGGVAANTELRATLVVWGRERGVPVLLPERALTTDNAAMIAWAGLRRFRGGGTGARDDFRARSRWPLGT